MEPKIHIVPMADGYTHVAIINGKGRECVVPLEQAADAPALLAQRDQNARELAETCGALLECKARVEALEGALRECVSAMADMVSYVPVDGDDERDCRERYEDAHKAARALLSSPAGKERGA